jgi:FMN phosphatase YigB (HAD superfamily)
MKTILVDAVDCFTIETNGKYVVASDLHELLETYPNRKILVTGANDDKYEQYALNKVPYEVFSLHHNPEKTDPKYFKMLLEYYGLRSNEVVYFDHNLSAVKSAEEAGIVSYFYDSEKRDLEKLRGFLSENV